MRTKILLTILLFSQLFTLGLAIDYSVNPVNPAQGANTVAQSQPATTGLCLNGFGWNGQLCIPCMQVKNGYCTCTKYGGCDTKVCDSSLTNCQVLTNGQNSYILLRATGCNNYAWGDSNTSVICTQCSSGYFMVAGICVQPNNCAQMNLVTGTCDTCVDGYYFTQNFQLQTLQSWDYYQNINQVICNKCLDNCKICTSGYTCVQCMDQYYWSPTQSKSALSSTPNDSNAGQCLACNVNIPFCIKCQNSTTCDKCLDGYYYTAPSDSTTKGTCTKCMSNCLLCQNADTCDTCDTVNNYIYLQANNQNSCALCTSITGCKTCSTQSGQLTCTACQSGYVFDSQNVCKQCDVNCASNSCSYTNDQVQCSNCIATFVLKSNTSCNSCGTGCSSCSYSDQAQTKITCGQCFDNYYKDDNSVCQLCSSSIASCQKCNYNSQNTPSVTCTQCSSTTKLTNDSQKCLSAPSNCLDFSVTSSANPSTCNTCADTYYLDSGSCISCTTANASYLRCSKSNNTITVIQCQNGYFLLSGSCVSAKDANTQATNLSLQTCQTIASGSQCATLTGTCDTCVDGYYFTQNFQLQTLQSWDYYQNINQVICNKCLNNCKICTSGYTCVQCMDQYYWSPTQSKSALSSTPNDSNAGQCLACNVNIPFCIKCQNSTTCDKCLDGYYYTAPSDSTTKGTCTKCMSNCLLCQNADTCDTCDTVNNYIYLQANNQNSCALCTSITGCKTCSTQSGQLTCTACQSGYVFDSQNVCKQCDVNCASNSCSYTNDQVQCSNCIATFVLKSNTSCNSCGTGCSSCSYSDQAQTKITCGQCFDNYYKDDNNVCQLCSSSIASCQKCNYNSQNTPSVTCTQCSSTTKLTNDSQKCLSAPSNCLDFSVTSSANPSTCNTCADTYYLDSGSCISCTTANASYLRCSKSNNTITVIQCQNGYFLLSGSCVSAKDANTQATNLSLQTCQTIASGSQCATCLPAALGTTPPQNGVCSYCNCSSNKGDCSANVSGTPVQSTVTCTPKPTCLPGFYLDGSSCLPCASTAGDLLGGVSCCGLGLIYTSGVPNKCVSQTNATGKEQLLASNSNAFTCDVGYYYNSTDTKCLTCINNCDICVDGTTCKTCSLNYTLIKTSNNGVQCVLIKCLVVDSTKGCTSCQYGFYLSNINGIGYCLQCLSPLTNSICRPYSNQAPNVTVAPATSVAVSSSPAYVCANGYYWNSQYCSPCKSLPTSGKPGASANGYCVCSTYLDCTSIVCNSGYALVQNTCQEIPKGCQTYMISNDGTTLICTACIASYSLVSNACIPSQNCQQFSTTTGNCVQCASGFYLNWQYNSFVSQVSTDANPYFNNFPSQCSACTISNCLTCTGPTVCTTCQNGYFWQTSQYLQQPSNGSQGSCQPCMQGCQTCSNNQSCQTCFSGYYMVYPYSGINYCQLCSTVPAISNCLTCDTSQTAPHAQSLIPTCRSCPSGYYLYSGKCVVCTGGCLACDADNSCTQCVSQGYAYDQANKKCVACSTITGCTSCSYNGTQLNCSACQDLYYRNTTNNITTCSLCSALAGKNYLRCVSSTSPTQCLDNFYLNGSSCMPQISNNKCLTYDNNSGCTSCITGYIIVGNTCQLCTSTNAQCIKCQVIANTGSSQSASLQCAACQTGYYLTTSYGCTACPNVKGCEVCNSAGCQTCSSGYYPTTVTTDTNNSTGTSTSNNTVTCNNCVSNCQICQQANSCTKCADGYFLVTTTSSGTTSVTTSSCFACQPECQTCVAPGTTCTSCIAGYVFQNGGCVTLAQANCYSVGTNGCAICKYGYYLNNGVCYQCLNPQADFLCTNPVDNLFTSATPQQQ
ncbi:unnamed protein product [Paramecium primaurelia]|uniref:EGF-like domain-containing protein n=1 Tax=Paramecium primaurelia TaxID=5886 RepID=A0A8S1NRK0_PARPR|nr:unnamed protein product [Paramecium primaurelia]